MSKRLPGLALLLVPVAVLAIVFPYLVAVSLPPGKAQFAGFLINPIDGFSYLAKMRQGYAGGWSFQLPYALEPGPGAYIFGYYILLGHLARAASLPLLGVYHASRAFNAGLMFAGLIVLTWVFIKSRAGRIYAAGWLSFGSGIGWLGAAVGVLGSDLLIPESVPFAAAFANAHFPLALAMIAALILLMTGQSPRYMRAVLAALVGLGLSLVLPFASISMMIALGLWSFWEAYLLARSGQRWADRLKAGGLLSLVGFAIGALPALLYDYSLTVTHPALSVWHAQNVTPSPGVLSYLLGLGPVLLVAAAGAWRMRADLGPKGRLLVAWAVSGLLLLYAPFGLQRRFSLGLFIPLALLAGYAYANWARGTSWKQWLLLSILLATVPTNLFLIAAGQSQVARGQDLLIYQPGEVASYEWIEENIEQDALILAAPLTGNRLPAFTDVRVVYGHPFETPDAENQRRLVEAAFRDAGGQFDENVLRELGIDHVYYGPYEEDLGHPEWLDQLLPVYRSPGVTIFSIK